MSPVRRLARRLAPFVLACMSVGCGDPQAPPAAAPGEGARVYDLEGRPLRPLPRILGWNVAVLAHETTPAAAATPLPAGFEGTQAVCPTPITWSSTASLLTGLVPSQHAVGEDGGIAPGRARAWTTVAEVLQNAYGVTTAALASQGWPASSLPLLQGFATLPTPGSILAQLEGWLQSRPSDRPFFVYIQLGAGESDVAPLVARLAAASGTRPLWTIVTHLRGRELDPTASSDAACSDATLLVPLAWQAPPATPLPPAGVALRGLFGHVLERLGAPGVGDAHAARWDAGQEATAHFEWVGSGRDGQAPRTRLIHGARGATHTYAVVYDMVEGTVREHLHARTDTAASQDLVGQDGRMPDVGLAPGLCRAIEEVRDLVWGQVSDVNWRIASGYVAGLKPVPGERPPRVCAR